MPNPERFTMDRKTLRNLIALAIERGWLGRDALAQRACGGCGEPLPVGVSISAIGPHGLELMVSDVVRAVEVALASAQPARVSLWGPDGQTPVAVED